MVGRAADPLRVRALLAAAGFPLSWRRTGASGGVGQCLANQFTEFRTNPVQRQSSLAGDCVVPAGPAVHRAGRNGCFGLEKAIFLEPMKQWIEGSGAETVSVASQFLHHSHAEDLSFGRVMQDVHAGESEKNIANEIGHYVIGDSLNFSLGARLSHGTHGACHGATHQHAADQAGPEGVREVTKPGVLPHGAERRDRDTCARTGMATCRLSQPRASAAWRCCRAKMKATQWSRRSRLGRTRPRHD
jgi:hypothetical protein